MSLKQLHRKSSLKSLSSTPFAKLSRIACYIKTTRKSLSSRQNLVVELITSPRFPAFPLFPVSSRTEDQKLISIYDTEFSTSVSKFSVCKPSKNLQVSCDSLPTAVSNSSEVSKAEESRMLDADAGVSDDEDSCCAGKPLPKLGIPAVFLLALLVVFLGPGKEVAVCITIATYLLHRHRRRLNLNILSHNEDSTKSDLSVDRHVDRRKHSLIKCNTEALLLKKRNIAPDNVGEENSQESTLATSHQISYCLFSRQQRKRQIKQRGEDRLIKQQTMPYIHHQRLITKPQEALMSMASVYHHTRENHDLDSPKHPVTVCNNAPCITQSALNRTSTIANDRIKPLAVSAQAYQRSKSLPKMYSQLEKDVKTNGKSLTIRTSSQTQESKICFAKFKLCVMLLMVLCGLVYGRAMAIFMSLLCGFVFSIIHGFKSQKE